MIRVKRSGIHGNGVFANKTIPKGTRLFAYEGRRLDIEEAEELEAEGKDHYLFELEDQQTYIDGDREKTATYVNHSCDPNAHVRETREGIIFYASRNIRPKEEIFIDYSYDPCPKPVPCTCGSDYCRGTINIQGD